MELKPDFSNVNFGESIIKALIGLQAADKVILDTQAKILSILNKTSLEEEIKIINDSVISAIHVLSKDVSDKL